MFPEFGSLLNLEHWTLDTFSIGIQDPGIPGIKMVTNVDFHGLTKFAFLWSLNRKFVEDLTSVWLRPLNCGPVCRVEQKLRSFESMLRSAKSRSSSRIFSDSSSSNSRSFWVKWFSSKNCPSGVDKSAYVSMKSQYSLIPVLYLRAKVLQ